MRSRSWGSNNRPREFSSLPFCSIAAARLCRRRPLRLERHLSECKSNSDSYCLLRMSHSQPLTICVKEMDCLDQLCEAKFLVATDVHVNSRQKIWHKTYTYIIVHVVTVAESCVRREFDYSFGGKWFLLRVACELQSIKIGRKRDNLLTTFDVEDFKYVVASFFFDFFSALGFDVLRRLMLCFGASWIFHGN